MEPPAGLEQYDAKDFWISGNKFAARYFSFAQQDLVETNNNLLFISDGNYLMPTMVAANSFIVNGKKALNVFIVVINCIDEAAREAEKLLDKGANIYLVALENPLDYMATARKYVTPAALCKFVVPSILSNYDQCLYADGDVIAFAGWDDIFDLPLNGKPLGAVTDFVAIYEHRRDKVLGICDYFNSGVLKFDLANMRKNEYAQKCVRLKLEEKPEEALFQDQDVFNRVFSNKRLPLSPAWNYMVNYSFMGGPYEANFHCQVTSEQLRIIHYSWLKPWLSKDTLMSQYWHDEYRRLYGRSHSLAPYRESEFSEARQNEYFRLAQPRRKSVLCVEMLHCHGEVMPGFVKYFQDRGYNVDVLWHHDLHQLDSLARSDKAHLRTYWNWQFSHDMLLTDEKIKQYHRSS